MSNLVSMMSKFPTISAQLRKSRNFRECPCCMSTFFHPSFIFSMFSSNSYLKSLGEHAPHTLIPSFQSFLLISFFSIYSSNLVANALSEHEVPHALFPLFILFFLFLWNSIV